MERIYLKPACQEILHKDLGLSARSSDRRAGQAGLPAGQAGKEGHLDLFTYDYETDNSKRKLGNLYLVGNVQMPVTEGDPSIKTDVTYITNLVASLAKREYYSNPDLTPKEAFSLALKKINDVVGEFFTNQDIKINIGIFAIAGEQINISKLGKFKIILSRENKNIDILNNIDLFTKERVQEKEFSHMISGKVMEGDKILAFYPGHLMTSRERYLKDYLLKLNSNQFREKINSIKEERPDFSCAALYINLEKAKEPALKPKLKTVQEPVQEPAVKLASEKHSPPPAKSVKSHEHVHPIAEPDSDLPRIIRAEFSLGKKQNPIQTVFNKIRPFIPRLRNKNILFITLIGVIIVATLVIKSVFILSPGEKQAAIIVEQANESLKLAKTKISQNDFFGARQLLMGSISSLAVAEIASDKTETAKAELLKTLDGIDQAIEVFPALVEDLPDGLTKKIASFKEQAQKLQANEYNINSPIAFDIYEDNLYVLTSDNIFKVADLSKAGIKTTDTWLKSDSIPPQSNLIVVDGEIFILNSSGALAKYYRGQKTAEYNTFLLSGPASVLATTNDSKNLYLINKDLGRIYIISKDSGSLIKTLKIGILEPLAEVYLDQDEMIYFTTSESKIWKVK